MDDLKKPIDQFLGLSEERIEALLRNAVEAYSDGELEESEVMLKGLIRLAPDDARGYKLLGSIHMIRERFAKARPLLERACEMDPDDPYVLVGLLEIYLDTNRFAAAVEIGARLAKLDPDGDNPAANRGRVLLEKSAKRLQGA